MAILINSVYCWLDFIYTSIILIIVILNFEEILQMGANAAKLSTEELIGEIKDRGYFVSDYEAASRDIPK